MSDKVWRFGKGRFCPGQFGPGPSMAEKVNRFHHFVREVVATRHTKEEREPGATRVRARAFQALSVTCICIRNSQKQA